MDYLDANMKQELRSCCAGMLRMWQNHTMVELQSSIFLLSWGQISVHHVGSLPPEIPPQREHLLDSLNLGRSGPVEAGGPSKCRKWQRCLQCYCRLACITGSDRPFGCGTHPFSSLPPSLFAPGSHLSNQSQHVHKLHPAAP